MTFNYVSLFSGVGGFELALNELGGKCVLASEFEKFAERSYRAIHGYATEGDVTKIEAIDVPDHDVLVGGFPCQAFSVAGLRRGYEDTRGTLFFEITRIAKEKKPKALFLENVKGLVNHGKGLTMKIMLETLNEIGYTVDFDIMNSKFFNVPQNRERVFILALRDDLVEQEDWTINGTTIVPKAKQRLSHIKSFNFDYPEQLEVTARLRDILETEVDEKYYLSDDKTANLIKQLEKRTENNQVEYAVKGDLITRDNPQRQNGFSDTMFTLRSAIPHGVAIQEPVILDNSQSKREGQARIYEGIAPTLQARDYKEPRMVGHVDLKGHDLLKRVYDPEHICPTLTTMGGGNTEPKIAEEVRATLTPERVEKRQNGRRFKENDEPSFTVNTQDRHGVTLGQAPKYRIRKLTPRECWRLQGFSDEVFDKAQAVNSDTQLYKQAGNAVTVNVIKAIGEKLVKYL